MDLTKEKRIKRQIVENGDRIEIEYVGKLYDETIFAKTDVSLEFKVGTDELIKEIDNAVIGMEIGQKKS
jgi:FKBP-type peptidyl-prolyl cis-trans isomerase 2